MRSLFALLACMMPLSAHAAVFVNEIAWMGTAQDPNGSYCEWIELANSGTDAVSLEGWTLSFGSASIVLDAQAQIPGSGYFVIERYTENACPDPVPQLSHASASFGNGIPNGGTVLKLTRADGSLEDQVATGDDWKNIGGDNTSKYTAQKTAAGWKTAAPTPGRGLLAAEIPDEEIVADGETETSEGTDEDGDESDHVIIELKVPDVTLTMSIVAPAIAYVNQRIAFDVIAKGLGKTSLDSLAYAWNFGDFEIADGQTPTHAYSNPGEYVVTVKGEFGRHVQVVRKTITVLPVALSMSVNESGRVLLHNDAKYEVNVSDFSVKGTQMLTFPERSIILPQGSIMLPAKVTTNAFLYPVSLFDQKGVFLSSSRQATPSRIADTPPLVPTVAAATFDTEEVAMIETIQNADAERNFLFGSEVAVEDVPEQNEDISEVMFETDAVPFDDTSIPENALPLLGLFGIVTLGLIGVFIGGKRGNTT